jgi:hypothetical protein
VRLSRPQFRRLLAEPDVAETIMPAFILRRVGCIQHAQGAVTLLRSREAGVADALRSERFLARNGYPLRVLDAAEAEAVALLGANGLGPHDLPVVLCGAGRVLRRPSDLAPADYLGLTEPLEPGAAPRARRSPRRAARLPVRRRGSGRRPRCATSRTLPPRRQGSGSAAPPATPRRPPRT